VTLTLHAYSPHNPEQPGVERLTGQYLSREDGEKGWEELHDFARQTLNGLIQLEERVLPPHEYSELRILARLDISVLRIREEGRYEYYVSELTHGHSATLFLDYAQQAQSMAIVELARAFGVRVSLQRMRRKRVE
jgi:uncharacterized protein YigA (DUF484 family)